MRKMLAGALIIVAGLFMLFAPTALAQTGPCVGDLNCDGEVGGLDTIIYKADYPRSPYLNEPCPEYNPRCVPAPVPRTGQTNAYGVPGSDGDLLRGVEWPVPRFTDNEDGTITDNLTGLIWLKDANCFGGRILSQEITDWNVWGNGQCGLTDGSSGGDWRLPSLFELESLRDMKYWEPALSNRAGTGQWTLGDPFTNLWADGEYWSSTTFAYDTDGAWFVSMYTGYVGSFSKTAKPYVWPVRGGH